jgi:hypothetical protein
MSGGQLGASPWLVFGDPDEEIGQELESLRREVDVLRKSVESLQMELRLEGERRVATEAALRAEMSCAKLQLASGFEVPQAIANKEANNAGDNSHKWRFRRSPMSRGAMVVSTPPLQSPAQSARQQAAEEAAAADATKLATQADLCRLRIELETMAARLQKALDASSEAVDKKLTMMLNGHQTMLQSQLVSSGMKQASNGMRSSRPPSSDRETSTNSRILEQGQKQLLEALSLQDTRVQRLEMFLKALGANLPAAESSV